ncbi:MAG: Na+/H+ antiporter subunit G [Bacteroidales bacterium]|nr:Na+/H+ antiporter subunit G [Bacteroidales bacterium]
MMEYLKYIGQGLIVFGSLFLFLGALGIFRMPDFYNRLQAGTKASTLGAMSLILGVGFIQPEWMIKSLIIVVFIAVANPLSSHALGRSAYKNNLKPFMKKKMDAYEKVAEILPKEEDRL